MMPNSGREIADEAAPGPNQGVGERKNRRRRVRLSCLECRKKKMSCDRNFPCQRCVRSGRPSQCSFETIPERPPVLNPTRQEQQIRGLQAEIAQLNSLLAKARLTHEDDCNMDTSYTMDDDESNRPAMRNLITSRRDVEEIHGTDDVRSSLSIPSRDKLENIPVPVNSTDITDPRERSRQGYHSRHSLFRFFKEIHALFPFIKETADEWFKPLGVPLTKNVSPRHGQDMKVLSQGGVPHESLLPPEDITDSLVSLYLDNLEQLHRIVHIPTFKREYANFWVTKRVRRPAMTVLVLAMISISTCAAPRSAEATSIPTKYRSMPVRWISACKEWLRQQSPKHHDLVHYQIACLVYMAERVTMTKKKWWWKGTSSLIQDAIMDGLHCDPSSATNTPYMKEMKRRIWAVLRELDLQSALESGLPTLLHNIDTDVAPPVNIEDEEFDETSKCLPKSKSPSSYTFTSYQVHCSRSWALRLEVSQRILSTRFSRPISYEEVLRYTHELTQAIDAIPSWDTEQQDATGQNGSKLPLLARAFLVFQLQECILALHRPYVEKKDGRYWLSETTCYHTSRDILLLNSKLDESGCQSLAMLRTDLLLASLTLVRITLLQPKGSTSVLMTDSQSSIDLLERCLPLMEDLHLRCCYSELWCFITMCAPIMLLKIHLGKESRQTAKAACARRFLDLHYKQVERRELCLPVQRSQSPAATAGLADETAPCQPASSEPSDPPTSVWLNSSFLEFGMNCFDLDLSMENAWDPWEATERPDLLA